MKTGRIPFTYFAERLERAVLNSLDEFMQQEVEFDKAKGWRDQDLPDLLPAIKRQATRIADRFNNIDSTEPGSAGVKFFDL